MLKHFREPMNGLTHFIAIFIAVACLVLLLTRSSSTMTTAHYVSFSLFGSFMILLFTTSTLYHWIQASDRTIQLLRRIDHVMIFFFIAASYTPICLVTLQGAWGWSIIGSIWGITLAGLIMKVFWLHAPRKLYTAIYLLMGWIIVIGFWPLMHRMDPWGLVWLFIGGGIFYSSGAVIYALKKPNPWPGIFGFHEIFHLCIIGGAVSHFIMLYYYV